MSKLKIASVLFFLFSITHILGIVFYLNELVLATKPFILITLLMLYAVSVKQRNKWYVLALVFSFLGDVFLMNEGELFFIVGLVSFLIAHILFIKIVISNLTKPTSKQIVISSILFLVLLFGLILFLKNHLNEMLLPVIVYGIAIATFGITALIYLLQQKHIKSLLMFLGAIVFISSDAILAIDKFHTSTHLFRILVMVTYILAQYLIYRSMILDKENIKE